jgi:hypothetical protein
MATGQSGHGKLALYNRPIPGKETNAMLALLPILLLTAAADEPAGGDASKGRPQVFIAPSGEPFRTYGDGPYPVAEWFAGADKNGDGKIDLAEFNADFLRFFDQLDVNHDGAIDGIERNRYETTVVPETMGGSWSGQRRPDANQEWASKFSEGTALPEVDRPQRTSQVAVGAARFDLLGLPEPVAAMDMEVRGRISRNAASEAARYRFGQLDALNRGYLTLDSLPRTPAEGRGGGHKHH